MFHFAGRGAMDIEGLGEKNTLRFLDQGLITDPASIYDLSAERITELEGFGEASAAALISEIERSKQSPFGRVARPEEVAGAVLALASPGAEWASGAVLDFNGASHLR